MVKGTSIEDELSDLYHRKLDKYTPSFASDLTVEDLKISGNYLKHSGSSSQISLAESRTLAGDKSTSITQGTKISTIQIGLDGYSDGEKVTGVEVYAVNKDTDTIVECIAFNGTGVARTPKASTFNFPFVDVEVNKSFGEDVYFIVGLKRNGNKGMRLGGRVSTGIAFDKTNDNELQVGSPIVLATTRIPFLYVYGEVLLSNAIIDVECNTPNVIEFVKANGTRIRIDVANGITTTI